MALGSTPVAEPKVLADINFVFGSNHNQQVKLQQMLVRLVNSLHALNLEVRVSHGRARGLGFGSARFFGNLGFTEVHNGTLTLNNP